MKRTRSRFNFLIEWTEDKAASTFARLIVSRHVADLRLIFLSSLALIILGVVFFIVWHFFGHTQTQATIPSSNNTMVITAPTISNPTVVAAIIGLGATALARLYQLASTRLGVVDLFGCEITTICRVMAVTKAATNLIQLYGNPPAEALEFHSEERYSPVFDDNAKELEVLEARVVERVTEFYTYLKASRDYRRSIGYIAKPRESEKQWNEAVRNLIYMLFLMLESARNSVERLVEYEPEWTLYTSEILLSEIVCYGFLLKRSQDEARERPDYDAAFERLQLRKKNYSKIIDDIYDLANEGVSKGTDKELWERVTALFRELNQSFHDVFGVDTRLKDFLVHPATGSTIGPSPGGDSQAQ